jgi:hypothetical protein
MTTKNIRGPLERKFGTWKGELLSVQEKIAKFEAFQQELPELREREAKLHELLAHIEGILREMNPKWDPEQIKAVKPGGYKLPFEIGTATRVALTILREQGNKQTSRQLAKGVLEREGILNPDAETVDRVTSAIDRSMRSKKDIYVKGEGSWPIYWSILNPDQQSEPV